MDYRSAATSDKKRKKKFAYILLRRGVITNPDTRLYISTVHGREELEETLDAFEKTAGEID